MVMASMQAAGGRAGWARGGCLRALAVALTAIAAFSSLGCGSKQKGAEGAETKENPLEDPYVILPPSAVALSNVDAKAFFQSGTMGAEISKLAERMLPIGEEAGFVASRDLDRLTLASYSTQGADVAAVLKGRFDVPRLEQMVTTGTPTRSGAKVVRSSYAGRTLYTINNVGFTVLTEGTVLAGTETAMRRALDRIAAGRLTRDFAPWMVETVETPNAPMAVAVDLANQPVANAAVGALSLPWLRNLKAARILGTFEAPGLRYAGTLTYGDEPSAQAGANGVRGLAPLVAVMAVTGLVPRITDLTAQVVGTDVQFKLAVDEQSMKGFLANLPKVLGS